MWHQYYWCYMQIAPFLKVVTLGIDLEPCARNYRHSFRENKPKTLVVND
jgi:hypothetical protein